MSRHKDTDLSQHTLITCKNAIKLFSISKPSVCNVYARILMSMDFRNTYTTSIDDFIKKSGLSRIAIMLALKELRRLNAMKKCFQTIMVNPTFAYHTNCKDIKILHELYGTFKDGWATRANNMKT